MFKIEDINYSYTKITRLTKNHMTSEFLLQLLESLTAFEEDYRFDVAFRQGLWDGKRRFYEIEEDGSVLVPRGLIVIIIQELMERGFKPNINFTYNNISKPFKFKENELQNFIT